MRTIIFLLFLTFVAELNAQQLELVVQAGHSSRISDCAFSSNNQWLVTGGIDETIKLWDLSTGKLIHNYHNKDDVTALEFIPNYPTLLSGNYGVASAPLKMWEIKEGTFNNFDFNSSVTDIDFSSSKKYLAVSSTQGYISLWDFENREGLRNYILKKESTIKTIDFSPDDQLLAGATSEIGDTNYLYIWKTSSDEQPIAYPFARGIKRISFINNKEVLVEVSTWQELNKVYRVDITNGAKLDSFNLYNALVMDGGKQVMGYSKEHTVSVIDLASKKVVKEIATRSKYTAVLKLSDDEKLLTVCDFDIEVFDLVTYKSIHYMPDSRWIDALTFSAVGNKLAFSSSKGAIINWDFETGAIDRLKGHHKAVVDLFYDQDGKYLASASQDSTVIVWNTDGSIKYHWLFESGGFNTVAINPSAEWLLVSHEDTIYSLDIVNGYLTSKYSFDGYPASKIIYSPNNRDVGAIVSDYLFVYDTQTDSFKIQFYAKGGLEDIAFSRDGKYVAVGGYNDSLYVLDVLQQKVVYQIANRGNYVNSVAFDPISNRLAAGYNNGEVKIYDLDQKKLIANFEGHQNLVNKLSFRSDGKVLASASWDAKLFLWDMGKLEKLAELYVFNDESWAVLDNEGRYDASSGGNIDHLHFVVEEEAISLDQMKERFYEPQLLQKLLGYNKESLRSVQRLNTVKLFPQFEIELKGEFLELNVLPRNGGIGDITFFINGKQIENNLSNQLKWSEERNFYTMELNLSLYSKYFKKGDFNELAIVAFNEENYLGSGKKRVQYRPALKGGFGSIAKPVLHGIVIGTADYRGDALDLNYADKDAESFASALQQAGNALFGKANVNVQILNTANLNIDASKENILKLFTSLADKANPNDVLVVYLSGHGVNFQVDDEGQFYYLTKDVQSGDLSDEEIRKNYAISTYELTEWINQIPVDKQVLILDACSSGKAIEDILVSKKSVTSSQIRAFERMKDRTGMFVITGSASDQVSYEASQYGQSLLTYSLLAGMKGQALREGEFVDVLQLFEHAVEQVPSLADHIGGVQKPIAVPFGGNSFDIGRVDETVNIELAAVNRYIRSNFQDELEFADVIGLSAKIDQNLRNIGTKGKNSNLVFVDVSNYPDAYSIKGRYSQSETGIEIVAKVFQGKTVVGGFTLVQPNELDVEELAQKIIDEANQVVVSKKDEE
ncbi:MAG: caspase family protein [Chitinophagales bacterium]